MPNPPTKILESSPESKPALKAPRKRLPRTHAGFFFNGLTGNFHAAGDKAVSPPGKDKYFHLELGKLAHLYQNGNFEEPKSMFFDPWGMRARHYDPATNTWFRADPLNPKLRGSPFDPKKQKGIIDRLHKMKSVKSLVDVSIPERTFPERPYQVGPYQEPVTLPDGYTVPALRRPQGTSEYDKDHSPSDKSSARRGFDPLRVPATVIDRHAHRRTVTYGGKQGSKDTVDGEQPRARKEIDADMPETAVRRDTDEYLTATGREDFTAGHDVARYPAEKMYDLRDPNHKMAEIAGQVGRYRMLLQMGMIDPTKLARMISRNGHLFTYGKPGSAPGTEGDQFSETVLGHLTSGKDLATRVSKYKALKRQGLSPKKRPKPKTDPAS